VQGSDRLLSFQQVFHCLKALAWVLRGHACQPSEKQMPREAKWICRKGSKSDWVRLKGPSKKSTSMSFEISCGFFSPVFHARLPQAKQEFHGIARVNEANHARQHRQTQTTASCLHVRLVLKCLRACLRDCQDRKRLGGNTKQ
jgi:hypothetical protein